MFSKKVKQQFCYLMAIGLIILFSSPGLARISPLAFHDVTSHFHPTKQFYSPTLGLVALETGLIHNLRFYGNFQSAWDQKERVYIKDEPNDPLWRLVKLLFPSPAGQLTVEVSVDNNFGKHVSSPKTVAVLLNYAHLIRTAKQEPASNASASAAAAVVKAAVETPDQRRQRFLGDILKSIPGAKLSNSIINGILKATESAIQQEQGSPYPTYTTEQVISAFFCEKFSTQQDIGVLLEGLDPAIVKNVETFPKQDKLITQEYMIGLAQKKERDLDDFYALANADMFTRLTPYKPGTALISNGNTRPFDRKKGQQIQGKTFADCIETTMRHLTNLMLFDPISRSFDLTAISNYVRRDNPYFANFEAFYSQQSPLLANDGIIDTRSLWNSVIGDLNALDLTNPVAYAQETAGSQYDLDQGYINLIRTDIFGSVSVSVLSIDTNTELFSFDMDLSTGHGDLKNLNQTKKVELPDFQAILHPGTTESSLWLLMPDLKSHAKEPLYRLMNHMFGDNNSRISTLRTISYSNLETRDPLYPIIQSMLIHLLENMSWDDDYVVSNLTSLLIHMQKLYPQIVDHVKGLDLTGSSAPEITEILKIFNKVERLTISQSMQLTELSLIGLPTMNKPDSSGSSEHIIIGLENCRALEYLKLSRIKIIELSLAGMSKLKELNLYGSSVQTLIGLEGCLALEKLDLTYTTMSELSLTGLPALHTLSLKKPPIKPIKILTLTSQIQHNLGEIQMDNFRKAGVTVTVKD